MDEQDFCSLGPSNRLTDKIISSYLELVKGIDPQIIFCLTTFFFTSLQCHGLEHVKSYSWVGSLKTSKSSHFIMPIHLENHWVLAIFSIKNDLFMFYDPLGVSQNFHKCNSILTEFVQNVFGITLNCFALWYDDMPLLKNGFDCGLYILLVAKRYCYSIISQYSSADYIDIEDFSSECLREEIIEDLKAGFLLNVPPFQQSQVSHVSDCSENTFDIDNVESELIVTSQTGASKRRLTKFTPALNSNFPFLDKIDDYRVKCARCRSTFSVKYEGRKAIVSHMQTKKHLDTLETIITQTSLESYSVLSEKKRILAAKEATWSYHTIKHNQSFRSMDCTSVLIRNLFASDFRCARTKTEAIVRNVLSPYSISQCLQELHECKFVSIYTDQSNHLDTKCFPILVRYFSKCNGISIKIIDFQSIPGETSDILRDSVLYTLKRFNLESKIVAICADDTNTNFGGAARRGVNNLYAKLKDSIHPHI